MQLKRVNDYEVLGKASPEVFIPRLQITRIAPIVGHMSLGLEYQQCLSAQVMLSLSTQLFYYNNYGNKNPYCTIQFFEPEEFAKCKESLAYLFTEVFAVNAKTKDDSSDILKVQMKGVSANGRHLFEKLKSEAFLPSILCDLYSERKVATDCFEKSLFFVSGGEIDSFRGMKIDFIDEILNNVYIKSIDISSMTLNQCLTSNLLKYITASKKNVFIYVDAPIANRDCQKSLFWI